VLVAASTHAGEDELVAEAVARLEPRPLLVVVPRHPERGEAVAEMLRGRGLTVARRAAGEALASEVEVYVADTLGELGLFYRLADAVVVGGSLVEGLTGHNPLEPARLGKPVVSGPHTASFADTYAGLIRQKAVLVAHDQAELKQALAALIGEPALAKALGARAKAAAATETEAFDAAWAALQPLLPPP
jgi:3-deoxy-D-manno-octulosonic-acid transferase